MVKNEQADITVVSGKGQVVIPHAIRQKLGIGPKTKLLVYGYNDVVIMKKIKMPDVAADLRRLYAKIDKKVAKYGTLSDADIDAIISETRHKRSSR
jgi:AbrB family looped-hinge helix DNA binding protein